MANVAHMLTQEPIYKSSSIFCFKPILLSAYKLTLLIYGDNRYKTSQTGAINAKFHATISRLTFSQRTLLIHTIGP